MTRARRATQKDVAQRAGVSQTTVSMVMGGAKTPSIPKETWERVVEAAKELGYFPNRFAQALKTQRTLTIACVVPDISNPFYPLLLRGVLSVTESTNYDVITINTDGHINLEQRFLEWSLQGRVDGIIGVFFNLKAADFRPLVEAGIAIARIEPVAKKGGELAIDDFYVDNTAAAASAVEHLIAHGHSTIAMIAGEGGPQSARIEGYKTALSAISAEPRIAYDHEFSAEGGYRAAKELMGGASRPTAIFAANDLMGIGAMQALRELGLEVPRDVAVIGFDDIFSAQLVTPPLTTVSQFQFDLGAEAARAVLKRLQKKEQTSGGNVREMPYRLIERATV